MLMETRYEHVVLDDNKTPAIAGTTMKVVELVSAHLAYGWSADELSFQYQYLTLGQIYSALAYYWDHREEFERKLSGSFRKRMSIGVPPANLTLQSA